MTAFTAGVRVVRSRLWAASSALGLAFALLAVLVVAWVERRTGSASAADRALTGVALGLALPLLAYGTVARALGGTRLDQALVDVGRFGGNRRSAALGAMLALALTLSLSGALIAALAVVTVRAPADAWLVRDLVTSTWIGALAGSSYALWFCLASTLGGSGGGRVVALIVDWIAGAGTGAAALFWPRGHVRNLLGAEPIMTLPQWSATLALLLLSALYALVCLWRVRR